jgi:RHS repeat-associated protein
LTSQQGQVAWQWLISGFGEVRPTPGDRGYGQTVSGPSYAQAVKFELRYPGQVSDEETGLSYNLHRYYDVATGRYIQADPIGLAGGWNRFGYVGGDPLNAIDPDGLNAVVALNRIAEVGRGLYYRYGPAITEFIAGASGVNGAVASPAAISPLVAQIPTGVSRMLPIARGISEGVESGAFCAAKGEIQETAKIGSLFATHGQTMSNKQLDRLIKDIRVNGISNPLVVTAHDGRLYILDGHHRALAAPRAGVLDVPIKKVDLPYGAYRGPADLEFTWGGY